jgi:hypothetical protein
MSSGLEKASNLFLDAPSSITSIALSGKNLSFIYLSDSSAAVINASSDISIL